MKHLLVDTNVIIRFLTNDDEVQSPLAYQIFEKAVNNEFTLVITPMIIAECTWVLQMNRYGYTSLEIAEKFYQIITAPGIKALEKETVLEALADFSQYNIDFIDAYLAANSRSDAMSPIVTWNKKDFKRLRCEFYTPEEL